MVANFCPQFTLQRSQFSLLESTFQILDAGGALYLNGFETSLSSKKPIRLFHDETRSLLAITISCRGAWNPEYTVADDDSNAIGSFQRESLWSTIWGKWIVRDADGKDIGILRSSNPLFGQREFEIVTTQRQPVATISNVSSTTQYLLRIDLTDNVKGQMDPRLVFAMASVLSRIERQDGMAAGG